jgi:hypothetical protein
MAFIPLAAVRAEERPTVSAGSYTTVFGRTRSSRPVTLLPSEVMPRRTAAYRHNKVGSAGFDNFAGAVHKLGGHVLANLTQKTSRGITKLGNEL